MISVPPLKMPVAKPLKQPWVQPRLLDPSIVAYYTFDRGPKLHDYSGKGNHGTIEGATFVSKGRWGPALNFDGVDDHIIVPLNDSLNITGSEITLAQWIYINATVDVGRTVVNTDKYWLGFWNPDRFRFNLFTSSGQSDWRLASGIVAPYIGQWILYVGIYDGENQYIYVNGAELGRKSHTGTITESTTDLYIGSQYNLQTTATSFAGKNDELMVLNRALSAQENKTLYEAGRP